MWRLKITQLAGDDKAVKRAAKVSGSFLFLLAHFSLAFWGLFWERLDRLRNVPLGLLCCKTNSAMHKSLLQTVANAKRKKRKKGFKRLIDYGWPNDKEEG